MSSPLKDWELQNIQYILLEYLRVKLQCINLEICSTLEERDENEHVMQIKYANPSPLKKSKFELRLEDYRPIILRIKKIKGSNNRYKVYMNSVDLILLRNYINMKILKIMNLYFTGESVKEWIINDEFLPQNASTQQKLAQANELRIFQKPKLRDKPEALKKLYETFSFIIEELTGHETTPGLIIFKELNAKPEFGGTLTNGKIQGQGIFLHYSGFSLEKLLMYHRPRCHDYDSVIYWILNALIHSTYTSNHFKIERPLDISHNNKYIMVISIDNTIELPTYLSILIDTFQVLVKTRLLGTINHQKYYHLTLSEEVVLFLNAYFYKRVCEALNGDLTPEMQTTSRWLFFLPEKASLYSKVCIIQAVDVQESTLMQQLDVKLLWEKLTGKPMGHYNKLTSVAELGGEVEIIRNNDKKPIGLFFNIYSLDKVLEYNKPLALHLTPSLQSQPDQEDEFKYRYARAFNGTRLINFVKTLTGTGNKPAAAEQDSKRTKLSETAKQPSLTFSIFDEKDNPLNLVDLQTHFPNKVTAADLQFFKKRQNKAPIAATSSKKHHAKAAAAPMQQNKGSAKLEESRAKKREYPEITPAQPFSNSLS